MNKKLLTLALTVGLLFGIASTALADTVPIKEIMSKPNHTYIINKVRGL